jgi:hypothetical protein
MACGSMSHDYAVHPEPSNGFNGITVGHEQQAEDNLTEEVERYK